jgi:DTW domain-containing protein YfiP
LKLNRVILHPKAPSAYGRLRKQPSNQHVSTLEATALALDGLGEEPDVGEQLRKVFRTLCQRARDAGVSNRTERDAPEALAVVKSVAEGKPIAKRSPKRPRRDDVAF